MGAIEVLQRRLEIDGDVCEIGVHHGRSFLCLATGLPAGQSAVAIDLFEDQGLGAEYAPSRKRRQFEANLATYGGDANVMVVKADSMQLERLGFVRKGRRFRVFSVDGGHTPETTQNDLGLAAKTTIQRGVVVLDDYLNPHWLGVITGLFRYWAGGGTLVPVAGISGRLLLAPDVEQAANYRELLGTWFGGACTKQSVPLGDHDVDVYGEYAWSITDDAGLTLPSKEGAASALASSGANRRGVMGRIPALAMAIGRRALRDVR